MWPCGAEKARVLCGRIVQCISQEFVNLLPRPYDQNHFFCRMAPSEKMQAASTALELAKRHQEGLARKVLGREYNGAVWHATLPITTDATRSCFTWSDSDEIPFCISSGRHLLAGPVVGLLFRR